MYFNVIKKRKKKQIMNLNINKWMTDTLAF